MIADCAEMLTQAFSRRNQHHSDSAFGRNANCGVNIESRHDAESSGSHATRLQL
jgi:hypothetical protein